MATRADKIERHSRLLREFVGLYCRRKHARPAAELCDDCRDLLEYALERLRQCPMDPKPTCRSCPVHCYRGEYRDKIRQVMKFSGLHFIKRGRLDWLIRYFR